MQCPGCQQENPSGHAESADVLNEARVIFSEAIELYRRKCTCSSIYSRPRTS